MKDLDPRVGAILDAAYRVFTTYGYRRTTMDDIARAAGMSRPALYTHFRNKEAIFRAYAEFFLARILTAARPVLFSDESDGDTLAAFFEACFVAPFKELMTTPHGMEISDVNKEIAGDLAREWFEGIEAMLREWLTAKAAQGRLDLGGLAPASLARVIVNAAEGIKMRDPAHERAQAELTLLAQMVTRAYSPRR